jgi:hypothetical protein
VRYCISGATVLQAGVTGVAGSTAQPESLVAMVLQVLQELVLREQQVPLGLVLMEQLVPQVLV